MNHVRIVCLNGLVCLLVYVDVDKVGGTILEDCSGSWSSRDVGKQFARLA